MTKSRVLPLVGLSLLALLAGCGGSANEISRDKALSLATTIYQTTSASGYVAPTKVERVTSLASDQILRVDCDTYYFYLKSVTATSGSTETWLYLEGSDLIKAVNNNGATSKTTIAGGVTSWNTAVTSLKVTPNALITNSANVVLTNITSLSALSGATIKEKYTSTGAGNLYSEIGITYNGTTRTRKYTLVDYKPTVMEGFNADLLAVKEVYTWDKCDTTKPTF